jgi:ribosomal-protein-alanine N-acetyltransferase
LLVATRAGQLAGFAAASALHAGPQIEAELETVGVAPAHQHQGAGRLLGTAILAWARELGASSITLEVRAASHGPQRLYRSLGFHPAGRRRDYYRSPPDDALLMRLSLAAEV